VEGFGSSKGEDWGRLEEVKVVEEGRVMMEVWGEARLCH